MSRGDWFRPSFYQVSNADLLAIGVGLLSTISPQFSVHPVLFPLSRKPDLLSQWRVYVDDGSGVAVGIAGGALAELPVKIILSAEYNEKKQFVEMSEAMACVFMAEASKKHSRSKEFKQMCYHVALFKYSFKNPSFADEQEVRCLHTLAVVKDDGRPRLIDKGGTIDGKTIPGQAVKFRSARTGLIAYIDVPFTMKKVKQPIREVWLGPKNLNAPGNIIYMMSAYGLKDYTIHRSRSSYR
jgi:Protein of unknown function (DUF2971)